MLLGGLIFIVLIVISIGGYWQTRNLAENKVLELELSKTLVFKSTLEAGVEGHTQALLSLSDTPPIQGIVRARNNKGINP